MFNTKRLPSRRAIVAGRSAAMTSCSVALLCGLMGAARPAHAQRPSVTLNASGRLTYAHLERGDHIADFSTAGYRGGGVALPAVITERTVQPSDGDNTAAIQQALDAVAKLPLLDGHRGAVLLAAGTFHCSGTLQITASGVVLRGDPRGTTLEMTGAPHLAIAVVGKLTQRALPSPTVVSDAYVPAGAKSFHVADAAPFHAGDVVQISKPVTDAWLKFMGMDALGVRNGKAEHWINGTLDIRRKIAAVEGSNLVFEVPLMDSYDAETLGEHAVSVTRVVVTGQIAEDGIEDLRIQAPARAVALGQDAEFDGIQLDAATDSWLRNVTLLETTNSVKIGRDAERITVLATRVVQTIPVTTSAKPFDFSIEGSQVLLDRCSGAGDNTFYVATQAKQQGPVVVLHCRFTGNGHIQPHQRWFTGLLVDNCEVPDGSIDLMDRGQMGSGHGWAVGWSVAWNNRAKSFDIQSPPGSANWSIGNRGKALNTPQPSFDKSSPVINLAAGLIESPGTPVAPQSLYLAQLAERLGSAAVKAIGY